MSDQVITDQERQTVREAFSLKQDDNGGHVYHYSIDENYYVLLSICERSDVDFMLKPDAIVVEIPEFEAVFGGGATLAPQDDVIEETPEPSIEDIVAARSAEAQHVETPVVQEEIAVEPTPIEEIVEAPVVESQPEPIVETIPEPAPVAIEPTPAVIEEPSLQVSLGAPTDTAVDGTTKIRQDSLDARERAVDLREEAVRQWEESINAREKELEGVEEAFSSRIDALEAEEANIAQQKASFSGQESLLKARLDKLNQVHAYVKEQLDAVE